jgi:hypothetical protein
MGLVYADLFQNGRGQHLGEAIILMREKDNLPELITVTTRSDCLHGGQSQPVPRFNIGRCSEQLNQFSEAMEISTTSHDEDLLFRLSALALCDTHHLCRKALLVIDFKATE